MKKKDIQFNVRIPEDLKIKIDEVAKLNQRSINAEIMSRLYDSFTVDDNIHIEAAKVIENFLQARTPSERKKQVAERLNFLLNEIKKSRLFNQLTISELAFNIGEVSADAAEAWFKAEIEPSFNQLEKISQYFSANPNWLLFGKDRPFTINSFRFNEDLDHDLKWLLTPNQDNSYLKDNRVKEIKLIRVLSDDGNLIIVKLYENNAVECFYTSYHISDVNGVGGYNSLVYLCLLFKVLKKYNGHNSYPHIYSHLLSEEKSSNLLSGQFYPLPLIENLPHVPWSDDLADRLPDRKMDEFYWPGFDLLRAKLIKDFNEKPYIQNILNDQGFAIKHPMGFDI